MKKLNIFLIIMILVLGGYLLVKQLTPKPVVVDQPSNTPQTEQKSPQNQNTTPSSTSTVGLPSANGQKVTIPEDELIKQIKNKRYLESTYMALEYSKVNNAQLRDTLKAYIDNNSKMKPEDVVKLVDIHEKTFLNRYLKVFVMTPDAELKSLNDQMRRIFYQMKGGFDLINNYGEVPTDVVTNTDAKGNVVSQPKEGTVDPGQPIKSTKKEKEPVYDINSLRQGIQQLEAVDALVDKALEELGKEDLKIEKAWIEAGLSEKDILEVIDKTNPAGVSSGLSQSDLKGTSKTPTNKN